MMRKQSTTKQALLSTLLLSLLFSLNACARPAVVPTQQVARQQSSPTRLLASPTKSTNPEVKRQPSATTLPSTTPTLEPPTPTTRATVVASETVPEPAAWNTDLRPSFADDLRRVPDAPRYTLHMSVEPSGHILSGTLTIVFTNTTGITLSDLVFRLYPNFPPDVFGDGGDVRMDILTTTLDARPVAFRYTAGDTAVHLPFDQPLPVGGVTVAHIAFNADVKPWRDGSYLFLAYYPMLAVHEASGWRTDVTRFPDHVFSEAALYDVTIDVPEGLAIQSSGSLVDSALIAGERRSYHIVAAPVRQFAWVLGDFRTVEQHVGDVTVRIGTMSNNKFDIDAFAQIAVASLRVLEQRLGDYPYRELDLLVTPYDFAAGDEFPGMLILYSSSGLSPDMRYVVAHEVAHQWWFGLVGNDIFHHPWMDEAMAQYSGVIAIDAIASQAESAATTAREIDARYQKAQAAGDLAIDTSIENFGSFNQYYSTTYGKGSAFMRAIREQLGDETFFRGLQLYADQQRYAVATPNDLRRAFEQASKSDLRALFRSWGATVEE